MKRFWLLTVIITVIHGISMADDCFTITPFANTYKDSSEVRIFSTNGSFRPFNSDVAVSGIAISGSIEKRSPDYTVRIVMTDKTGKEHLILESYEEINSDSIIQFTNYSEEAAILQPIITDSIKVYLYDATVQIDDLQPIPILRLNDSDVDVLHVQRRRNQVESITNRINAYNKTHDRFWFATETSLSMKDYATRKMIMGLADDTPIGGLEYYGGGLFEIGHSVPERNLTESPYADHFDWRNRQGKNWMTSVKDQDTANYCAPFAVVGCMEAMVNLYYNKKIDLDLSEMEIVCCSDTVPHAHDDGFSPLKILEYVTNHGVCDETSYPYDLTITPRCISDSITPVEQIQMNYQHLFNDSRQALIANGPLIVSVSGGVFSNGHAMVLVGYGTVHQNDTVFQLYDKENDQFYFPQYDPDDGRIGDTYYIFKNSWGDNDPNNTHGGYMYVLDHLHNMNMSSFTLTPPVSSLLYDESDIVIEDQDGDGYYYWGIGQPPARCPLWVPDMKDLDDTDPTVHEMDPFGNFPETYHFPISTNVLNNNDTISGNNSLSCDIEIPRNVTLTITGNAYCLERVKIKSIGGTLVIDGGVLANAEIELDSGSTLIVKNGGTIFLKNDVDLNIPVGCIANIPEGSILPRPKIL